MEITRSFADTPTGQAATGSKSLISSDFTTFLRMLTAQMENQDPLDPMKTEEFATQLATFSGVEQQVRSNTLLEQIAGRLGLSGISAYAGWIGQEARAAMPAKFSGQPIEVLPGYAAGADAAKLAVRDAAGQVVQTQAVAPGTERVQWAGVAADGTPFPAGLYRFEVESFQRGQSLGIRPAEVYAELTEARLIGGQPMLIFAGDTVVAPDQVTGLRQPGG